MIPRLQSSVSKAAFYPTNNEQNTNPTQKYTGWNFPLSPRLHYRIIQAKNSDNLHAYDDDDNDDDGTYLASKTDVKS